MNTTIMKGKVMTSNEKFASVLGEAMFFLKTGVAMATLIIFLASAWL